MRPPSPLDDSLSEQRTTLSWATRLWVMTFVFGQVIAAGLAPGLQGAFVGAGPAIRRAQLLGSHVSQFAALLGLLLLVYLGVLATRAYRALLAGIATALMGTIPAVVLYHASRGVLPSLVAAISAVVAAGVVLSSCMQSRAAIQLRTVGVLCAIALCANVAGYLLLDRDAPAAAVRGAAGMTSFLSWIALGIVYFAYVTKHRPIVGAFVLCFSLLPAGASQALRTTGEMNRQLSTLGHTISALAGEEAHFARDYGFTLALVLVAFSVISRRASLSLIASALLVLCMFSPITPAGCAAITLAGYLLVLQPDAETPLVISST